MTSVHFGTTGYWHNPHTAARWLPGITTYYYGPSPPKYKEKIHSEHQGCHHLLI